MPYTKYALKKKNRIPKACSVKTVKKLINKNIETKVLTHAIVNLAAGTQQDYSLSRITQGDTATTRDGRAVKMSRTSGHLFYHNATNTAAYCRTVLMEIQAQTGAPTMELDLQLTGPFKPANVIRVLKDEFFIVGGINAAEDHFTNRPSTIIRHVNYNHKDRPQRYSGASAGDTQNTELVLVLFSNVAINMQNLGWLRTSYKDI